MSSNDESKPPAVEQIREKVLEGRALVPDFAAAIDKSPRAVHGYIAMGLPVDYIGRTPYVVVDRGLEWLRSRRRRDPEPRRRGRPRAAA